MKLSVVLTSLGLAGLSLGQFQGLPSCAQDCAGQFLAGKGVGDCGNDVKCICSNQKFIGDIACCLAKPGGCSPTDQSSAVTFASQICAIQGITVPSAVVCTSTGTAGGSQTTPASTGATPTTGTGSTTPAATGAGNNSGTRSSTTAGAPRETGAAIVGGLLAIGAALL